MSGHSGHAMFKGSGGGGSEAAKVATAAIHGKQRANNFNAFKRPSMDCKSACHSSASHEDDCMAMVECQSG